MFASSKEHLFSIFLWEHFASLHIFSAKDSFGGERERAFYQSVKHHVKGAGNYSPTGEELLNRPNNLKIISHILSTFLCENWPKFLLELSKSFDNNFCHGQSFYKKMLEIV